MNAWQVLPEESGCKLIEFLKSKLGPTHSSRAIKRWIESNHCQINGRVERFASIRLGEGDQVLFDIPKEEGSSVHSVTADRILYEDEHLFIYDKPSGVVSDDPAFHQSLKKLTSQLYLIHRLDKETSGALMFAKELPTREAMIEQFRQHQVKKTYLALVDGVVTKQAGSIDNYLGKVGAYQGQSIWGSVPEHRGLHAKTDWIRIKKGNQSSMLHCFPVTGRTHQIRVHLSSIKHPILGDYQYGKSFRSPYRPQRCLLHALELSLIHPFTQQKVDVAAPIPEDILSAMKTLEMDL
jgi:RluA family pseudouridine synthase